MNIYYRQLLYIGIIDLVIGAFPCTGLWAGDLTIDPKISTSRRIDDNFYNVDSGVSGVAKEEVATMLVQPAVDFNYDTDQSNIYIDYSLNRYDYSSVAVDDSYTGHTALYGASTELNPRLAMAFNGTFNKTRKAAVADPTGNSIARTKYTMNRYIPELTWSFSQKFSIRVKYMISDTDYESGATREDYDFKSPVLRLIYNISDTASIALEYKQLDMDYSKNTPDDYQSKVTRLVFNGHFSKVNLGIALGNHDRTFDGNTLVDFDQTVYRARLIYDEWLTIDKSRDYATTSQLSADVLEVSALYTLMTRVTAGLKWRQQDSDYKSGPRYDENTSMEANLGYIFNYWFTASLAAGKEERESNKHGRDYDNGYKKITVEIIF
jgi:hypothetical protein